MAEAVKLPIVSRQDIMDFFEQAGCRLNVLIAKQNVCKLMGQKTLWDSYSEQIGIERSKILAVAALIPTATGTSAIDDELDAAYQRLIGR